MTYDEFLRAEFEEIAEPGEEILCTGLGWFGPGIWAQALLLGGLLSQLLMKFHFAILTNQRLILIRTKSGWFKLRKENHGVKFITGAELDSVELKGAINQRRLVLSPQLGSPWFSG